MREINIHPILQFSHGKELKFTFDGKTVKAYEGETVAMALYRSGIDIFSESPKLHRPRGMFCAIGKCSSCMMRVNGIPNIRTCILPVREEMVVEKHERFGKLPDYIEKFAEPFEINKEVAIIGSGPAGLSAATTFKEFGIKALIIEENPELGGQLIKQTHKFFGSEKEKAGTRGFEIARDLIKNIENSSIDYITNSTAFAIDENKIGIFRDNQYMKIYTKYLLIATGAAEKMIPFPGNDIPGVFGAGAAQTLMNVFSIKPGRSILMIGAGNVGLIVSYQLLQAGIEVKAVVEAMPTIGGYFVHAAKLRRFGVPILTSTTIKEVRGNLRVEKAITISIDKKFKEIPGTEIEWNVDTVCLSTGLIPSVNLLAQAGCKLKYVTSLGGFVPVRNKDFQTTNKNIFTAGDVTGIEEASTAILEGHIAALAILEKMGLKTKKLKMESIKDLNNLRGSPFSKKVIEGLKDVEYE
ncbi:MAG: FAD-dependent oxidoreductase [Caldiserica bacterium]|nr:FAD-dependent oxidoreductase [Caldisericota bacterium]